jgi:hypothetical protein
LWAGAHPGRLPGDRPEGARIAGAEQALAGGVLWGR